MKSPKPQPTDAQLVALAKRILELSSQFPNNYDLGERVRLLHDLAIYNPSLLINNQKAADHEQNKTISGSH